MTHAHNVIIRVLVAAALAVTGLVVVSSASPAQAAVSASYLTRYERQVVNAVNAVGAAPGDLVAIEAPAFYACLQVLERLKLKAVEIPVHPREGMDLGADDFVTKPFSVLELLGRVEAVLRRAAPAPAPPPPALALGPVEVDFHRLQLRRDGCLVDLPERAIELLRVLVEADGRIVTRDGLIDKVWGVDQAIGGRRIDNLVVKLRQALEPDPASPRHILTVHGRGYRFVLAP